ncbi:MAG TPA: 30S ribosomal protein S16 [bacterium]|nr:30S ribosomal protein S16 [bacterium]
MLKIKLARIGKKKAPIYRFIISEVGRDPYGRVLENLGSYNPKSKELQAKAERINHWISQGAQMTVSVNNLLVSHKIVKGEIIRVISKQVAPAAPEVKEAPVAPAAKEEAPVAEEAAPVEETPAEETPVEEVAVAEETPTEEAPAE